MSDGPLLKNLRELIEAGGVEALVRAAGERAMRHEREFWLPVLERYKLPEDSSTTHPDRVTSPAFAGGSASSRTSRRCERKHGSACASTDNG